MLLSNDGVLQSFAPRQVNDGSLIIGPAEASDLFQSSSCISSSQLNSIVLAYASTNIDSECVAAKFIDVIIEKAQSGSPDWKLFTEMKSLVSDFLHERAKTKSSSDDKIKKLEIELFLKKKGIPLSEGEDGD